MVFRSLKDLWAAKCFLFSPAFTLVVWCAMGWVVGVSWFKLCMSPCPGKEGQSQTSSLPERGHFPGGQERTPGWGRERCPFVTYTAAFIHRAQGTWSREVPAQICQPCWSRTRLWASLSSQRFMETLLGEKSVPHHSTWLCCIMTIFCAAGNSLLPKSLQNDSRN